MEFIIKTKKSKNEIAQILQKNTSEKIRIFCEYDEFFNGEILEESFKIQRNITYKNSFLPVIIGKIKETENGSEIYIKMRLNHLVKGFMTFWFSFVILFCLSCLTDISFLLFLSVKYRHTSIFYHYFVNF